MRVVVDLNRCQGYAQCVLLAPDVFKLHGEEALMYDPNPDDSQRQRVLRAAASCPVQAILVERLDDAEDGADVMSAVMTSSWSTDLVEDVQGHRPDRHRRRLAGRAARRRSVARRGLQRAR